MSRSRTVEDDEPFVEVKKEPSSRRKPATTTKRKVAVKQEPSFPASSQDFFGTSEQGSSFENEYQLITRIREFKDAIIYSKPWLMSQLDELSVLVLTNLNLFGSSAALPLVKIIPDVKSFSTGPYAGNAIVKGVKIVKGKLPGKATESDKANGYNLALLDVFAGVQYCLKFIFFIGCIYHTKKSFKAGVVFDSETEYNQFPKPFYKKMAGDLSFVSAFNSLYETFIYGASSSEGLKALNPVAFSLSIVNQSEVFDFGSTRPEGFRGSDYSIQKYVSDIYVLKSFLEKMKFFLESMVPVPKNYIATISVVALDFSNFARVFTAFKEQIDSFAFSNIQGSPFVKGTFSSFMRRLGETGHISRDEFNRWVRASEQDPVEIQRELEMKIAELDASYQSLQAKYNQVAGGGKGSTSPSSSSALRSAQETINDLEEQVRTLNNVHNQDVSSMLSLEEKYNKLLQAGIFDDKNISITREMFNQIKQLSTLFFVYVIFMKIRNWFGPSVKSKIDAAFTNTVRDFPDLFSRAIDIKDQSLIGDGGFLRDISSKLQKIFESEAVERRTEAFKKVSDNFFNPSSDNWIFGNFSSKDADPRFLSCELIRKITPETYKTINVVVFMRRLLIAKTFVDIISKDTLLSFKDLLDKVYTKLSAETNQSIFNSLTNGISREYKEILAAPTLVFKFLSKSDFDEDLSSTSFSSFSNVGSSSTARYDSFSS